MEANPHHYVEMAEFGLPETIARRERLGRCVNTTILLGRKYYHSKGLPTMCVTGVRTCSPSASIVLSTCLLALVGYAGAAQCGESWCPRSATTSARCLGTPCWRSRCAASRSFAYWAWSAVALALSLRGGGDPRFFVGWACRRAAAGDDLAGVVERVVRSGVWQYQIAIHRRALSAHDIAYRVVAGTA